MALSILVIGILGNITAMMLFLSPIRTFWEICKKKSTCLYSGLPYVCSLLNCLLWTFYGLPFITKNNLLVLTINGSGSVLEFAYVLIFLVFAAKKTKGKIFLLVVAVVVLFSVIVVVTMTKVAKDHRALVVGSIALMPNTAMYASPLSVMKLVIRTKSVESMPFLLSLWTFLNSSLWTAYGVYQRDKFLIIPNGLGVVFGIMQLVLYGYYRNGKTKRAVSGTVAHAANSCETTNAKIELV